MRHARIGFAFTLLCVGGFACDPRLVNDVGELNEGGADGSGATGGTGATGSGATGATSSGATAGTPATGGSGSTGGTGMSGSTSAEGGAGVEEPVIGTDPQNCGEEECPGPTACSPPAGWEDSTVTNGVLDFVPVEVWRGYVVGQVPSLPVESESVVLHVKERTGTSISGALVFGEGDIPAPASDPAVGYIPTEVYGSTNYVYPGSYDNLQVPDWWAGYPHSILDGEISGSRVQFAAHATEQWRGWCEMVLGYQLPLSLVGTENGYSCVPEGSSTSGYVCEDADPACEQCLFGSVETGGYVEYDCRKARLCARDVCQCEGECCTASRQQGRVSFDARLENGGTELNGSIIFGEGEDYDVYLTLED